MVIDFPAIIEKQTVGVSRRGFGTILIHDPESVDEFTLITEENLKDFDKDSKVYKIAQNLFMQNPAPQEVAIAGGDIDELAGEDFFFLTSTDNTLEQVKEYAKFAAVNSKMYFTTVHDLDEVNSIGDIENDNTVVMYHDNEEQFPAESLSVVMSYNVGGKTAKFKKLNGISPASVSLDDFKTLEKLNILTYVRKLGTPQVSGSTVISGERIDVMLGEYWIRFRIEEDAMRLAVNNDKIPYDNKGIGALVGVVESVLSDGVEQDIIMRGQYKVEAIRREDVNPNDVSNRFYDGIQWSATLSGAIEEGPIYGVLTYDLVNNLNEGVEV